MDTADLPCLRFSVVVCGFQADRQRVFAKKRVAERMPKKRDSDAERKLWNSVGKGTLLLPFINTMPKNPIPNRLSLACWTLYRHTSQN